MMVETHCRQVSYIMNMEVEVMQNNKQQQKPSEGKETWQKEGWDCTHVMYTW